jgi:hypothetical protein
MIEDNSDSNEEVQDAVLIEEPKEQPQKEEDKDF